jgi:hypothetical protein
MDSIPLHVEDVSPVTLTIGGTAFMPGQYRGEYRVTPSGTAQVLATAGKVLAEDVTVDPIPSNYGLVTWDGSTITVS